MPSTTKAVWRVNVVAMTPPNRAPRGRPPRVMVRYTAVTRPKSSRGTVDWRRVIVRTFQVTPENPPTNSAAPMRKMFDVIPGAMNQMAQPRRERMSNVRMDNALRIRPMSREPVTLPAASTARKIP